MSIPVLESSINALPCWMEIQSTGMPCNKPYFETLLDDFNSRLKGLSTALSYSFFDYVPINPQSEKQTEQLCKMYDLYPTKRTKPSKKHPRGKWSYGKPSIEHLRYQHPALAMLFDWREIAHLRDSFIIPALDSMVDSNRHRTCRDTYNITGDLQITRTASRRPSMKKSSTGVNLLNLPSRQRQGMIGGLSKSIRAGYIAPRDELLGSWDLSQIELRVLASESRDDTLCDIFHSGRDPHDAMARRMFHIPDHVKVDADLQRKPAKNTNFMVGYGGSGRKMSEMYRQEGLELTPEEGDRHIRVWYNACDSVLPWKEKQLAKARRLGYVESSSGMRRYVPDIWNSRNSALRADAERYVISMIIQGTAQDMIQNSMGWIHNEIKKLRDKFNFHVRCALQLYDELIYRFSRQQHLDDGLGNLIAKIVIEGLTKHHGVKLHVPVLADGGIGDRWSEI